MKVFIGSDHGGFEMKKVLVKFLKEEGYSVEDLGPTNHDPDDDYPDFGEKVAKKVAKDGSSIGQNNAFGILICRSAAGIIIAANKVKGIRAVSASNEEAAKHSRQHNDANVLGLSGDWTSESQAKKITKLWLETPYSNEPRHTRRLKKIQAMEK